MGSRSRDASERTVVVVTDTTVLVNLIHIDRTEFFARIPDYEFILPEEVFQEVMDEDQRAALGRAVADNVLRVETITDVHEIALKIELSARLGQGESACLAIASARGYAVATDDIKAARVATELLGEGRILTTPGLLVLAIRVGLMTVEEADACKRTLESRRFIMSFGSFREIV